MQFMVQDIPEDIEKFLITHEPTLAYLVTIVTALKLYVAPLLVVSGILGNVLTAKIFGDVYLRRVPVVPYVRFLCMSDSLFLCTVLLVWLRYFGFYILAIGGWCQAVTFISHSCMFLSIWLTVLCTIGTLVSCHNSMESSREHDPSWCMSSCWCYASTCKTTIIAIGFVILAILVFVNIAIQFGPLQVHMWENNMVVSVVMCLPMPDDIVAMEVLKKLDVLLNTLLPYVLIFISITVTLTQLWIQYRHGIISSPPHESTDITSPPSHESASLSTTTYLLVHNSPTLRLRHVERDVIRSVIVNVILFLLCTLPSQCLYLYIMIPTFYKPGNEVFLGDDGVPKQLNPPTEIQTLVVSQLLMFLVVLRCTLAFVIYVSASQYFRFRVMRLIFPKCYNQQSSSMTITQLS